MRAPRHWARLAREAGMRYVVFTTKHHDGFCLWDTAQTDFNSVRRGPRHDIVREYVDACRAEGLKVGLYYSLMDWRHPDGWRCAHDEAARRRFLDFTQGCVRELMSNYGRIDLLWYDIPQPLPTAEAWESARMNAMVRRLQPTILINNRSRLDEDFGTPEGEVHAAKPGRLWEACMTFNGDWGYSRVPDEDWLGVRSVVRMLRKCAAYGGNLLLNNGPMASGEMPPQMTDRLRTLGRWLARHDEAVYGDLDRIDGRLMEWGNVGFWTMRGNTAYHWLARAYPGTALSIGGVTARATRATLLDDDDRPLTIDQPADRLIIRGLPETNPDPIAGVPVVRIDFADAPHQSRRVG